VKTAPPALAQTVVSVPLVATPVDTKATGDIVEPALPAVVTKGESLNGGVVAADPAAPAMLAL